MERLSCRQRLAQVPPPLQRATPWLTLAQSGWARCWRQELLELPLQQQQEEEEEEEGPWQLRLLCCRSWGCLWCQPVLQPWLQ